MIQMRIGETMEETTTGEVLARTTGPWVHALGKSRTDHNRGPKEGNSGVSYSGFILEALSASVVKNIIHCTTN